MYYDFTDLQEARLHIYRLGDRHTGNEYPMIHPTIVIDWSREECYLLIETNEPLSALPRLEVFERDGNTGSTYSYKLDERGKENMLEFATKIYEGIMVENELFVVIGETRAPLMERSVDRESYRIVMSDYYRLTRIIR